MVVVQWGSMDSRCCQSCCQSIVMHASGLISSTSTCGVHGMLPSNGDRTPLTQWVVRSGDTQPYTMSWSHYVLGTCPQLPTSYYYHSLVLGPLIGSLTCTLISTDSSRCQMPPRGLSHNNPSSDRTTYDFIALPHSY